MAGVLLLILRLAMAVTLYLFLGWAVIVLWRDLKLHSELLTSRHVPPISLSAIFDEGTLEYQFKVQEILVGRDPACDVLLEDLTVSGQHARLSYHHSQWWVEDLQSRNGTCLNHEPITSQVVLANGDELLVGQVIVQVAIGER